MNIDYDDGTLTIEGIPKAVMGFGVILGGFFAVYGPHGTILWDVARGIVFLAILLTVAIDASKAGARNAREESDGRRR